MGNCEYLDKKHTIFGEIIGGLAIIDKINTLEADKNEKPLVINSKYYLFTYFFYRIFIYKFFDLKTSLYHIY